MGGFATRLHSAPQAAPQSALDWGFPVRCLPLVKELQAEGVRLIWFDGDRNRARTVFQERGGLALSDFDAQVAAIAAAGFPKSLDCVAVRAPSAQGTFKHLRLSSAGCSVTPVMSSSKCQLTSTLPMN